MVEGGSLAELLVPGPLPPRSAADLLEKIARAVHYAHQQGVVHRDLKPANTLLRGSALEVQRSSRGKAHNLDSNIRPQPDELWPMITDFGLAKQLDGSDQTETGQVLRTPSYMAPEQARGQRAAIGPMVDVYALGAILYQMVTGRPTFQGVTSIDTVMQVLNSDPVPPRQLQPRLPKDLHIICLKCLEKEPHRRYPSPLALAEDLRRFQAGEPIHARPVGALTQTWRWCRRHPTPAAILLAFVAGFIAVTWSYVGAENARREEVRARQQEKAQRELAELRLAYSRIALAETEWQANNVARAEHLLDLCRPRAGLPELHDWEWHYLKRLCHADLASRRLHAWPIYGLAFSPNGRYIASAAGSPGFQDDARTTPGEVRIWETDTWRQAAELPGHTGRASAAVFSPDGSQLASIGLDNFVRVWDTFTWQQHLTISTTVFGDYSGVGLSFSPDGKSLAVVNERRLQIHNATNGELTKVYGPFPHHVVNAVFSPAGNLLVIGTMQSLCVYQADTGRELCQVRGWPLAMAFSPDGQILAAAREQDIALYEAATGQELRVLRSHNGLVRTLAWSPDGHRVASGGADQTVRLWDPSTGLENLVLRGHRGTVARLAFHSRGDQLVSGDQLGNLKVWEIHREQRGLVTPEEPEISDIAFSAEGRELLVARYARGQGGIIVWDVGTGRRSRERAIPWAKRVEWPLKYLALGLHGNLLAAPHVDDPNILQVWDVAENQVITTLRGHQSRIRTVAFSTDARWLASAAGNPRESGPGELFVWQLPMSKTPVSQPTRLPCPELVQCLAFSPDGQFLLAGERAPRNSTSASPQRASLSLWHVQTASLVKRWEAHPGTIQCVAWQPDGQLIASGGRVHDRTINIWRVASGELLHTLQGPAVLTCLNFSPNGRRLAAVGYDGIVILIDPFAGQEVLALRGLTPQRPAEKASDSQVVFSPDGHKLAVNAWNGSVCIFDATPIFDNSTDLPP